MALELVCFRLFRFYDISGLVSNSLEMSLDIEAMFTWILDKSLNVDSFGRHSIKCSELG